MNTLVFEFRYLAQIITECQLYAATGRLICRNGPKKSELYYYMGRIVHAENESTGRSGPLVLSELLRWQEGEFYFEPGVTAPKHDLSIAQDQIFLTALTIYQKFGTLEKSIWVYPTPLSAPNQEPGTISYPLKLELDFKSAKLKKVFETALSTELEATLPTEENSSITEPDSFDLTEPVPENVDEKLEYTLTAEEEQNVGISESIHAQAIEFTFGDSPTVEEHGGEVLTTPTSELEFSFSEQEQVNLTDTQGEAKEQHFDFEPAPLSYPSPEGLEAEPEPPESTDTLEAAPIYLESPIAEVQENITAGSLEPHPEFSFDLDHQTEYEPAQPQAVDEIPQTFGSPELVSALESGNSEISSSTIEETNSLEGLQYIPESNLPPVSQDNQNGWTFEGEDNSAGLDNGNEPSELGYSAEGAQEGYFDFDTAETSFSLDAVGFAFEAKIPQAMVALIELVSLEKQNSAAFSFHADLDVAREAELPLRQEVNVNHDTIEESLRATEDAVTNHNSNPNLNGLFENFPLFNPVSFSIQSPEILLESSDQPESQAASINWELLFPNLNNPARPRKDFELALTCLPVARLTHLSREQLISPNLNLNWLLNRVATIEVNGFLVIDNRNGNTPYYARLFFLEGEPVKVLFDDGDKVIENDLAIKQLGKDSSFARAELTVGRVEGNFLRAYFGLHEPAPSRLKGLSCQKMNIAERLSWLASNRFTGVVQFYNANRKLFYLLHEGRELGSYEVVDEFLVRSNTPLDYILTEPETYMDLQPARIPQPLSGFSEAILPEVSWS